MPILMSAELHRFALGVAEDRMAQVLGDPQFDGGLVHDLFGDLVLYHGRCFVLAESGDYPIAADTVVMCNRGQDTHRRGEMFYSTLSREHTGDGRYNEVAWHHAMVSDALEDDCDGLAERYFGKGCAKGQARGRGKGMGRTSTAKAGALDSTTTSAPWRPLTTRGGPRALPLPTYGALEEVTDEVMLPGTALPDSGEGWQSSERPCRGQCDPPHMKNITWGPNPDPRITNTN